ncbi:MAG: FxsA family protein [Planctomycetes bacterium]|nr:FxsA family protein [Planctomycetota bacterium]
MLLKLFLLFTVVPLLEVVLLFYVEEYTNLGFTLALILLTGMVGAALARHQGWQTSQRIKQELARGRMPGDSLLDGLLILIAGALLVTPGILTDLVGFSLLVPGCRRIVKRRIVRKFKQRFRLRGFTVDAEPGPGDNNDERPPRDVIIDARVIESDKPAENDAPEG